MSKIALRTQNDFTKYRMQSKKKKKKKKTQNYVTFDVPLSNK